MTGLAAGWASGLPVYEAESTPGGICSSYYVRPGRRERLHQLPENGEAYRFEVGGGHWIFGGDPVILRFIRKLAPAKTYQRISSVYFPDQRLYVPYPLQNHLGYLSKEVRARALVEMLTTSNRRLKNASGGVIPILTPRAAREKGRNHALNAVALRDSSSSRRRGTPRNDMLEGFIRDPAKVPFRTMADWLVQNFGPTLTDLFFGPFHEFYTAGLWKRIAPQDPYKSPIDARLVIQGSKVRSPRSKVRGAESGGSVVTPAVGYNPSFLYPQQGLNALAQSMARRCDMRYGKRVKRVDVQSKVVFFEDGSEAPYQTLVSTLPLSRMIEMTGLRLEEEPDPYTSVLVLNIGAVRGAKCPSDHWVYLPSSRAGFHRVGFYSNVDVSFLPACAGRPHSSGAGNNRVSLYVERVYVGGQVPSEPEVQEYSAATVRELQEWEFIESAEVVDPTWIDVAYTWSWPDSQWRSAALKILEEQDIQMIGRYARWVFQGIADSLRDGLYVGAANKSHDGEG